MAPNETAEVDVIGGGPVGLATALQLVRPVSRRSSWNATPAYQSTAKPAGIHVRTMEIFRRWNLPEEIRRVSVRPPKDFTFGWMTRIVGEELGTLARGATEQDFARFRSWSPKFNCGYGQNRYEPVLFDAVLRQPSINISSISRLPAWNRMRMA